MKRLFLYCNVFVFSLILVVLAVDWHVKTSTEKQLYDHLDTIPHRKVGLLLGTSKYAIGGKVNLYYKYRIEAAAKLFHSNKVEYILVSGDNGTKHYDEPTKMKKDLLSQGIPEDRIVLDYAGFRTLDSVVRANEVFLLSGYTVISQQFHNERAVFLGKHYQHEAIGFNAQGVSYSYGMRVQLREYLARVKMVIDLLVGVKPKFLGEQMPIG